VLLLLLHRHIAEKAEGRRNRIGLLVLHGGTEDRPY